CFPQHGGGTARDCIGDEAASVGRRTGKGCESVARLHLPAISSHPLRSRAEPCQQRRYVERANGDARHQVSSRISPPSGGRITFSTGASAGTHSIRSPAPVTVEKTGAVTSRQECAPAVGS